MIKVTYGKTQNTTAKDGGILRKTETTILVNDEKYYGRSLVFATKDKDSDTVFAGEIHYIYDGAGIPMGSITGYLTSKKLSDFF